MSLLGKLFRGTAAAASVAIASGLAGAQEPIVAPHAYIGVPGFSTPDAVTPAAGFGRGTLLNRGGAGGSCAPCAPCTPATPCPVTGQPMTGPTGEPVTPPGAPPAAPPAAPAAPDFGDLSRGAGVGPTVGLNGYIENAAPVTMARIRFDAGYDNNRPDRGNVFYAKCGCFRPAPDAIGPPLPEKKVDYQELTASAEYAFSQRFSAFFNIPIRYLNPDVNANAAGLSDVSFGAKYAFIYTPRRIVSFLVQFQAPSGGTTSGLGDGVWWVQPAFLYLEQLSPDWQLFGEFRFQTWLGRRTDFTGNFIRYGLGTSYVVAKGRWGYVAPVVEAVGWTMLSGQELNPDLGAAVSARGDTIVNAKLGVRIGIGAPQLGSPYPTRSDLYVGYGRALTGEVWYKDLLRVEYRRFF
jgi:hypothetical protein